MTVQSFLRASFVLSLTIGVFGQTPKPPAPVGTGGSPNPSVPPRPGTTPTFPGNQDTTPNPNLIQRPVLLEGDHAHKAAQFFTVEVAVHPRLHFGRAHDRRWHGDPKTCHDACKNAGSRIGVNAAAHIDRRLGAVTGKCPALAAEIARSEDAVVRGEICRRFRGTARF